MRLVRDLKGPARGDGGIPPFSTLITGVTLPYALPAFSDINANRPEVPDRQRPGGCPATAGKNSVGKDF